MERYFLAYSTNYGATISIAITRGVSMEQRSAGNLRFHSGGGGTAGSIDQPVPRYERFTLNACSCCSQLDFRGARGLLFRLFVA